MGTVDQVLGRLQRVVHSGGKWTARCPSHEDRVSSLSIAEGDDGRVLLKCFAGCNVDAIVAAIGLEIPDLFPDNGGGGAARPSKSRATAQRPPGCTLEAYSGAKRIPVEVLQSFGLSEIYLPAPTVRIPYIDGEGNVSAIRFRTALEGEDRFRWKSGAKPTLYGLNRLVQARSRGYAVLVEGESDAHTLWAHDYPAIGLPGASGWREDRDAEQFDGLEAIYVLVEPDKGGETVLAWLAASRIRDRVRLVRLEGAKDPSELYLTAGDAFGERFEAALQGATPWAEHEQVERDLRRGSAWEKCEALAHEPSILDRVAADVREMGIVGEEKVVRLVYLALTSRVLKKVVSVAIKGLSSAGKSHTLAAVLRLLPPDAYYAHTGMSERALVFGEESLRHKFIVLYEAEGMQEGFHTYVVRSLLSEGRISYPITEKGADGKHVTRTVVREGPTGLIVTTTAVRLHEENETRLFSLIADDSAEQTKRVLHALAADAEDERQEVDVERWHALQRWIESGSNKVTVPFAGTLADAMPPAAVRLRRDFGSILGLIKAHALLHQARRELDARGRVVATLDDYAEVRALASEIVADGVEATVPAVTRELVSLVKKLTEGQSDGVSIKVLADRLKLDKSAVSRRWSVARDRGYLKNLEERRGRPAQIVVGEPLPEEVEILPPPERLAEECCTVARVFEGRPSPPPPRVADTDVLTLPATSMLFEDSESEL